MADDLLIGIGCVIVGLLLTYVARSGKRKRMANSLLCKEGGKIPRAASMAVPSLRKPRKKRSNRKGKSRISR